MWPILTIVHICDLWVPTDIHWGLHKNLSKLLDACEPFLSYLSKSLHSICDQELLKERLFLKPLLAHGHKQALFHMVLVDEWKHWFISEAEYLEQFEKILVVFHRKQVDLPLHEVVSNDLSVNLCKRSLILDVYFARYLINMRNEQIVNNLLRLRDQFLFIQSLF